jgi:hypothetical protein
MKLYGAEQISLFSDRLLFSELGKQSGNAKAKEIYKQMIANSAAYDTKNKPDSICSLTIFWQNECIERSEFIS